jgi:hypothetical protein
MLNLVNTLHLFLITDQMHLSSPLMENLPNYKVNISIEFLLEPQLHFPLDIMVIQLRQKQQLRQPNKHMANTQDS